MTFTEVRDLYLEKCKVYRNEKAAAAAVMVALKSESPEVAARLKTLVAETKFSVRNYGNGQFYSWAEHDLLGTHSPWPAAVYPTAVLCMDFAMELATQEQSSQQGETDACHK